MTDKVNEPNNKPRFPLGRTVATAAALRELSATDIDKALRRHHGGDWGDVCPQDKEENESSLREGLRLLSAYKSEKGLTFWVITEADRSQTTVLLPSDY
jgi:hypothetical protein